MRNKLKALLAGFIGIFAFTTAAATTVDAVGNVYNIDVTQLNAAKNNEKTASDTVGDVTFSVTLKNVNDTGINSSSSGETGFITIKSGFTVELTFTTINSGYVNMKFDTRGEKKIAEVSRYVGSEAIPNYTTRVSNKSGTYQDVSLNVAAETSYKYRIQAINGDIRFGNYFTLTEGVTITERDSYVADNLLSVVYDANGGEISDAATAVASGSSIKLPTTTRENYTFDGWTIVDDSTGTKYNAGSSYTVTADVKFIANWTENEPEPNIYTLTYNLDGGTLENLPATAIENSSVTLGNPSKSGFTFNNWTVNGLVISFPYVVTADTLFVANYTQNTSPDPIDPTPSTSKYTIVVASKDFTDKNNLSSDYFTVTGNWSDSRGSATYNGIEYKECLKMESATKIAFTSTTTTTLTLVFGSGDAGKRVKIDDVTYITGENGILVVENLPSGSHTITKGDTMSLFYIELTKEVELKFFQQEAVDGTTTYIRFIGIISDVMDVQKGEVKLNVYLYDGAEKVGTITRDPHIYTTITSNGETYSAPINGQNYEFTGHDNEFYAVWVIKFSDPIYSGKSINADLTYSGATKATTKYTFA